MNRFTKLLLFVAVFSAGSAAAQESRDSVGAATAREMQSVLENSGLPQAMESLATKSAPEIERALEQLTGTLSVLADRVANDQELRTSALRTASGMIGIAQILVTEQSEVLLEMLRTASESLSAARAKGSEPVR